MNQDTLLAYIAGVFDADGSVAIDKRPPSGPQKTPKYTAIITIQMAEKPTIEFIANHYEAQIYFIPAGGHKSRKNPKRKNSFRFQLGSRKAANFLRSIQPFVKGKRNQVDLCLEFCDRVSNRVGQITTTLSQEEVKTRHNYYQKLRDMKKYSYDY